MHATGQRGLGAEFFADDSLGEGRRAGTDRQAGLLARRAFWHGDEPDTGARP